MQTVNTLEKLLWAIRPVLCVLSAIGRLEHTASFIITLGADVEVRFSVLGIGGGVALEQYSKERG